MSDTRRVSLLMGRRRHTGEIKLAVFIKMLIRRRLNLIDKLDINGAQFQARCDGSAGGGGVGSADV